MTIQRLSSDVSSKIAAGEVIERPASVARELIDNALDSGATNIRIVIEDGGKTLIDVGDDGAGIAPAQLPLAIERHSTSKLSSVDDLTHIQTLGFRGEALASIVAVAELSLRSVNAQGEAGLEIQTRGNSLVHQRPVGGARGTRAIVRGLFRTLPARLEFLRANRTESNHVANTVTRAALAHPDVSFELRDNERIRIQTPGTGNLRDALTSIYGIKLVDDLIELPPGQTLGIDGFISQPHLHRPSRSEISFFVNGRWVTDRLLSAAVSDAYRSMVPSGRFPIIVLRLSLPPEEVDVNVHPAKAEIRFRQSSEVFRQVSATLRRALSSTRKTTPAVFDKPVIDQFFFPNTNVDWRQTAPMPTRTFSTEPIKTSSREHSQTLGSSPISKNPEMRALGQVDQTYIVAISADGLYLIDQHAAHERVLYEQFESISSEATQQLLDPLTIVLSAEESEWVSAHKAALQKLGLMISLFGPDSWLIRSVPLAIGRRDAAEYLRQVIAEALSPEFRRLEATEQAHWSMACRAAIKSGDKLSTEEMDQLIEKLQACDLGLTCPHGRPTIVLMTRTMLDKQFGRI
ncbi:MAG TPA: DNA mismatch repair endonuclease MutL [Chloroflexi bacterium]|nr:DNA mismatch repair endonuclease MutL [Chloroflexota bacterium]|tara:strand:+ start:2084 stop:3805 length:1722 start_codon:yes stop_codon:yes gene_type:complete